MLNCVCVGEKLWITFAGVLHLGKFKSDAEATEKYGDSSEFCKKYQRRAWTNLKLKKVWEAEEKVEVEEIIKD